MKPVIEVKNLGKKYNIAHMRGGYVALRDVIAGIVRRPFSFLKYKAKQAVGLAKKEEFWALKDVNFNINKGEIVGIIGANGAGKSTLLKVLSQITPPTEGEIIVRGRIGSLLEVGTGFHPELTGRENIFLNGAILGMKKREIEKKFNEIVAFAGVEKFLDTPVKHYSSGMYVRLAFSVAAHMESDILLVDEVLAVGDAEFQKKCLGKMDEITKENGRTILFVSHNLSAIQNLCPRTIVIEQGKIVFEGETSKAIEKYVEIGARTRNLDLHSETRRRGDGRILLRSFHVEDSAGNTIESMRHGSDARFVFEYECKDPSLVKNMDVGFSLHKNGSTLSILYASNAGQLIDDIKTNGRVEFNIRSIPLAFGRYDVGGRVLADGLEADWPRVYIGSFEVNDSEIYKGKALNNNSEQTVILNGDWTTY